MQTAFRNLGSAADTPPTADRELTLCEMLADAIVIRLMERDGVTRAQILKLFTAPERARLCCAA